MNEFERYQLEHTVVEELKKCVENEDTEMAHIRADGLLLGLLETLGFKEVCEAYHKVTKWYA
jgi:hypothetical protein